MRTEAEQSKREIGGAIGKEVSKRKESHVNGRDLQSLSITRRPLQKTSKYGWSRREATS